MISRRRFLAGATVGVGVLAFPRLRESSSAVADVNWFWAGGVTDSTATVVASLGVDADCRLKVSTAEDLTVSPIWSDMVASADGFVKMTVSGLTAHTYYFYGVEHGGVLEPLRGRFFTFPTSSTPGFTFTFGSCSLTASNHLVWQAITQRAPLFFAHLGDFHYENIATNTPATFRAAYNTVMGNANRAETHRSIANLYIWDDHDYGPDNSDSTFVGRPASSTVYRQAVPHYSVPGSGDNPIYQTFDIGRVKFIATDVRHQRSPNSDTDNASKTMLGAAQKAWFKGLLDDAAADPDCGLIIWLSAAVWCVDTEAGADHWGGFNTERVELANYMKSSGCPPVLLIGGDTHSVCFDDGRRGDYATGGGAPVASFHASALDQGGLTVGQNWMSGSDEGGGRFGSARVTDDGTTLAVHLSAVGVDPTTGAQTRIKSMVFQAEPTRRNARVRALVS